MGSLLFLAGPVLAALIPYLSNWVTPLEERIFKHASSTKTGVLGSGLLYGVLQYFPCLTDLSAWQKVALSAIPVIFGALSASKPATVPKVS